MTTFPPFPVCYMDFQMLRASNYLEIAGRVIERVAVDVVDVLRSFQLSAEKPLHNNSMLRFIVPPAGHHISITILDVFTSKDPSSDRLAVAAHKRVVVGAKPFGKGRMVTPFHVTNRAFVAVRLLGVKWVAVFIPALVMLAAQPIARAGQAASVNRAIRSLFWHKRSIAQGEY